MHDHCTINYNKKFRFKNLECDQHGERDCQRNTDDTQHKWSSNVKALIGKAINDRDKAIEGGYTSFSASYIRMFEEQFFGYLSEGWEENEKDPKSYGAEFE